jgi:hypothetical protein
MKGRESEGGVLRLPQGMTQYSVMLQVIFSYEK